MGKSTRKMKLFRSVNYFQFNIGTQQNWESTIQSRNDESFEHF